MSYGIEIFDSDGNRTLGMEDFTYNKIFEVVIPRASESDTSSYIVDVPGFVDSECIIVFTPLTYSQGEQSGGADGIGFVPVYYSAGGTLVAVVRRGLANYYDVSNQRFVDYYTRSSASVMQVYKYRGV